MQARRCFIALLLLFLAVALPPLVGALFSHGFPWRYFTELPPQTHYIQHAGRSTPVIAIVAVIGLGGLLWCSRMVRVARPSYSRRPRPWWGAGGVMLLAAGWISAWGPASYFGAVQPFSFAAIWFGYILTVESLLVSRGRGASWEREWKRYLSLYGVSALFWWTFELLNRFVQNWSYPALERFSAAQYVALASLAFSTVLPAVLATARLLESFTVDRAHRPVPLDTRTAGIVLIGNCLLLTAVPHLPNELFALVWISPLTSALCLAELFQFRGPLSQREPAAVARWALAALGCGFLWEMWNMPSAFKWLYHIPYVEQWHLFEMPLLGFAGYLPFGVLCGLVIEWISIDASER